jgi:hypothetical protein
MVSVWDAPSASGLATGIAEAEDVGVKATAAAAKPTKQSHFMQSPPDKNEPRASQSRHIPRSLPLVNNEAGKKLQ